MPNRGSRRRVRPWKLTSPMYRPAYQVPDVASKEAMGSSLFSLVW